MMYTPAVSTLRPHLYTSPLCPHHLLKIAPPKALLLSCKEIIEYPSSLRVITTTVTCHKIALLSFHIFKMISNHRYPTRAPGDEDLPDLIVRMPIQHAQLYPETSDTTLTDLSQQYMSRSKITQDARAHSSIDEVTRTKHHIVAAFFAPKPRPDHGLDLAYNTTAQEKDSVMWPGREKSACASCSKWSLACIHAAALNAFDEHDSASDRCHAARATQQLLYLQDRYGDSDDASPPLQHQKHKRLGPPMLQRWLGQSPRQEGFDGVATAQALSAGSIKSRL